MKKIVLAMLFSVFLLSAMTVPSLSQIGMTIGVAVGDYFTFEQESISYSTPNASVPVSMFATPFLYLNTSLWVNYTVTAVNDTSNTITFDVTTKLANGTETTSNTTEQIETSYVFMTIGADMEADDVIRNATMWTAERTINETIMIGYATVTREVNVHYAVWDFTAWGAGVSERDYYWDKATGMLVKEVIRYNEAGAQGAISLNQTVTLNATSLWVVPEFPTVTVMLFTFGAFVSIIVPVVLYRRKKLKTLIS